MGRKIAAKHLGPFYDHNGIIWDKHSDAYRYEDGKKWIIREKYGVRYLYTIFYCCEETLRIPECDKDKIYIKSELQRKIDDCLEFLSGNPLSGSYNVKLRSLLEIQAKYFTNSIDFIMSE
jgi:hypothetical protein